MSFFKSRWRKRGPISGSVKHLVQNMSMNRHRRTIQKLHEWGVFWVLWRRTQAEATQRGVSVWIFCSRSPLSLSARGLRRLKVYYAAWWLWWMGKNKQAEVCLLFGFDGFWDTSTEEGTSAPDPSSNCIAESTSPRTRENWSNLSQVDTILYTDKYRTIRSGVGFNQAFMLISMLKLTFLTRPWWPSQPLGWPQVAMLRGCLSPWRRQGQKQIPRRWFTIICLNILTKYLGP